MSPEACSENLGPSSTYSPTSLCRMTAHMRCVKIATLRRCSVSASNGLVFSSISENHASAAASAGASNSLVPTSSPRLRISEANESTIRASKRANPAVYPPSSHSRCGKRSAPRGPHASWYQVPLAWHVEVTLPANCAEGKPRCSCCWAGSWRRRRSRSGSWVRWPTR